VRVGGEEKASVTQPGRSHIDQNFAPNRRGDVHVLEIEPTTDCVKHKRFHVRPSYVRTDLTFQSGQEPSAKVALEDVILATEARLKRVFAAALWAAWSEPRTANSLNPIVMTTFSQSFSTTTCAELP